MADTTWIQEAGMTGDVDTDNLQDIVDQAEGHATDAETSATNAAVSENSASASATSAANSATAASTSATAAASSESLVQTYSTNAATSATNAAGSATAAASSASSAATSATAASASETAALVSEGNAGVSETNAANSATSAATSATNSAASATASAGSASAASTSATNAATSATSASTSATAATTSATNASTSETNAAASASSASTSETNAAASEAAAGTSETNAATSATNAATSATNAATSESNAAASATSASNSAAAAASALDNFDDRYLGAYATDPTTDNDGDPLVTGALYFSTTDTVMKIWEGSSWIAAASAQVAAFEKYLYTATASQTVFSGTDDNAATLALTVGTEIVTLNGIVLEAGTDYTATSSSITLTTGASVGDELNVFAFGSFAVADTVSASTGGTFQSNIVVSGNVDAQTFTQDGSPLEAGAKEGIFWENGTTVSANYTITAGKNAGTFGPVTIADGVTVQIPDGSTWTVI